MEDIILETNKFQEETYQCHRYSFFEFLIKDKQILFKRFDKKQKPEVHCVSYIFTGMLRAGRGWHPHNNPKFFFFWLTVYLFCGWKHDLENPLSRWFISMSIPIKVEMMIICFKNGMNIQCQKEKKVFISNILLRDWELIKINDRCHQFKEIFYNNDLKYFNPMIIFCQLRKKERYLNR